MSEDGASCSRCNGAGKITCRKCDGSGRYGICVPCSGTGQLFGQKHGDCDGTGQNACVRMEACPEPLCPFSF